RTSVNDIYRALVDISGFEAPIARAERRAGDARDIGYDPALAREVLQWSAQTNLRDGMRETYEYFAAL
ncbi:MAG: UDP-glucose 4-epimerase, partial [Candidatus Baltobacteraceae bacterium]